jgi:hypothetical protein
MIANRRPRGQALPLALCLAGVGGVALIMLYNGGQTVAARVQLTHATDAAAYSGALVQARALNLLAYINRAQVAHQVAMAHLVTLASWAQFGQTEAGRLLRGNPPMPLIGMLFGPAHGTAYAGAAPAAGAGTLAGDFAAAYARHDAAVHDVLTHAAEATLRTLPNARRQAMQAVVQANYPEFGVPVAGSPGTRVDDRLSLTLLTDNWPGYVRRYAGNAGGAFRSLVLQATDRYGFLDARQGTARNAWPVSFRCPHLRHELRRRGYTSLGPDGAWHATDTQSFHALRSNKYIGCYYREYAMGWGAVEHRASGDGGRAAADEAPEDFSKQDFWRWVRENTSWDIFHGQSNPLANAYAARWQTRWPGRGMPGYAEIPFARAQAPARFSIALRQPQPLLATTDAASRVSAPRGHYAYAGLDRDQGITVVSAAETYFVRPVARRDGLAELPTLFRPYWQARLVAASSAQTRPEQQLAPR